MGSQVSWDRAGRVGRSMSERVRNAWLKLGKPPPELVQDQEAALTQLLGHTPSDWEDVDVERILRRKENVAVRGLVWPMKVPEISLPDGSTPPVAASDLSSEVAWAFGDEKNMLHSDWERRLQACDVEPYNDPCLKRKQTRLELAARLWKAQMLRCVAVCRCYCAFFCVIKKVVAGGSHILRLTTDLRKVNQAFRVPPWVPLCGPGVLSTMDVSQATRAGWGLSAASGDAPDFYYTLSVPEWASTFLVLEGVTPGELREYLISQGFTGVLPDPEAAFLALAIVAMGWSWAVWVAQMTMLSAILGKARRVVDSVTGVFLDDSRLLIQGKPTPRFAVDGGLRAVVYAYIDDYGVYVLENLKIPSSLGVAKRLRDLLKQNLRNSGLASDKDVETQTPGYHAAVSVSVGGESPEVVPFLHRLWVLILGTLALIRLGIATPAEIATVVGSWSWPMQLARPAYYLLGTASNNPPIERSRLPRLFQILHSPVGSSNAQPPSSVTTAGVP